MKDIDSFQVIGDFGELVTCEVLAEFEDDETGNYYLLYLDGEEDEDGDPVFSVSRIDPEAEELELIEVTEEERPFVESVLEELIPQLIEEEE